MNKVIKSVKPAVANKSLLKVTLYSLGSFFAAWAIIYTQNPEIATQFGQYAWMLSVVNILAVTGKKYIDALRTT